MSIRIHSLENIGISSLTLLICCTSNWLLDAQIKTTERDLSSTTTSVHQPLSKGQKEVPSNSLESQTAVDSDPQHF